MMHKSLMGRGVSQQPQAETPLTEPVPSAPEPSEPPMFAAGVAKRKWQSLQAEGYRMQSIRFAISKDGVERVGQIDPWGKVVWDFSPAPPVPAAPASAPEPSQPWRGRLRTFLNSAAGEGFELDGVDAADLYLEIFGEPE